MLRFSLIAALLAGCATPGIPERAVVVAPEIAASNVSESPGEAAALRALAAAGRAGYRWGPWGLGGGAEINFFRQRDLEDDNDGFAAVLVGIDGEYLSADGWLRTRVGGGLAVLIEGTSLDEPGLTGFYADIRPGGFRFLVGDDMLLTFDPLSLAVLVPDASGIPLVDIQYRSNLALEFSL